MEKKVLKACALGLCATTVFVGGPKYIVNAQEVNGNSSAYTEQTGVTDKTVVDVRLTGSPDGNGYLYAVNKNGKTVWSKKLTTKQTDWEGEYYLTTGVLGDKYYYLNNNGKLYALDIQTGEIVWQTNSNQRYQEGMINFVKHVEADDKLIEISSIGEGIEGQSFLNASVIAIYDINTGKLLKTVKNISDKYIKPYESNGWKYYSSETKYEYINKTLYMGIDGYHDDKLTNEQLRDDSPLLKIDLEKYKIEFSKSRYDKTNTNVTDKKVVSVTPDVSKVTTIDGKNEDGEIVWSIPTTGFPIHGSSKYYGVTGANNKYYYLYHGNSTKYYYGTGNPDEYKDGKIYTIDMQTGEKVWDVECHFEYGKGAMLEVNDKLFVSANQNGRTNVIVYDINTHEKLKTFEDVLDSVNVFPAIMYHNGMYSKNGIVYIPVDALLQNSNTGAYEVDNRVGYVKFDSKKLIKGYEKYKNTESNLPEKKVVDINIDGNKIYGLNAAGNAVWSIHADLDLCGLATDEDNKYQFILSAGKLYALDMQTGKKLWSTNVTGYQKAIPMKVVGDKLVLMDYLEKASIYDIKTGKLLKSVKNLESYIPENFVNGLPGTMKSENGKLYITLYRNNGTIGCLMLDLNKYKITFTPDFNFESDM